MRDRQSALDDKKCWRDQKNAQQEPLLVGKLSELDKNKTHVVEAANGRYCVVFIQGQWHAYSAVCPHQLGKLDDANVTELGQVSCPWHGYRFDIRSGESLGNPCANLPVFSTKEDDECLFIIASYAVASSSETEH